MTFEKILAYEQSDKDRILADIAQTIIEAYNGSYKPHLFDWIDFCNNENYYSTIGLLYLLIRAAAWAVTRLFSFFNRRSDKNA